MLAATTLMKANGQYIIFLLESVSCKVVETSESLGEIFMCDYSNDSY